MDNQRCQYLDVAKGLLILEVIFAHVFFFYWGEFRCDVTGLSFLGKTVVYAYCPYVMAAFFIMYGYYSNHKKTIEEVCKYGVKRLLVPMTIILLGFKFWFCWAMFFSLIFYSIIRRIKPRYLQVFVIVLLPLMGLLLKEHGLNVIFICQAMVMIPFLYIGEHCRIMVENSIVGVIGGILYLLLSVFFVLNKELSPFVGDNLFFFSYKNLPLFYILAISGSSALITISRLIGSNNVLEYIGRNSLQYCLIHISISLGIIKFINFVPLVENSGCIVYVFLTFSIFIALVLVSTFLCALINKHAPWVMGKGL